MGRSWQHSVQSDCAGATGTSGMEDRNRSNRCLRVVPWRRRLTLPSRGRPQAGFACLRPPLMSNVGRQDGATCAFYPKWLEVNRMNRRDAVAALVALGAAAASLSSSAQQGGKVWRVGYLSPASAVDSQYTAAFLKGMRELGYVEGKNLVIEWRSA